MDFPMNLGTFNAYITQPLKIMFPNSSSNQFIILTSQQYNIHTFISQANNHMPFHTLLPWSMWNKGTGPPEDSARHMVNILKITHLMTDPPHSTFSHPKNTTITHTHSHCQQLSAISYTLSLEHMD
jgi:hypothetical protein